MVAGSSKVHIWFYWCSQKSILWRKTSQQRHVLPNKLTSMCRLREYHRQQRYQKVCSPKHAHLRWLIAYPTASQFSTDDLASIRCYNEILSDTERTSQKITRGSRAVEASVHTGDTVHPRMMASCDHNRWRKQPSLSTLKHCHPSNRASIYGAHDTDNNQRTTCYWIPFVWFDVVGKASLWKHASPMWLHNEGYVLPLHLSSPGPTNGVAGAFL